MFYYHQTLQPLIITLPCPSPLPEPFPLFPVSRDSRVHPLGMKGRPPSLNAMKCFAILRSVVLFKC